MSKLSINKYLELTEKGFTCLGITFFSGVFHFYSLGQFLPGFVSTSVRYSVLSISILLLCFYWKNTLITVINNILFWIFTVIILMSTIWSEFPSYTSANMKEVWFMTLFGLYFATRFTLKEQINLVATTLICGGILSTLFALGMPSVGKHIADHPGAWKGIYGYKNTLGSFMVLNSLTFWLLPKDTSSLYRWGGFSLSVALIILSTSKTSLVLLLLLMAIVVFYQRFRWQGKISVVLMNLAVLCFGCLSFVIFTNWVEILTGLGRDATLTGRTPLWGAAIARIFEKPLFGYGRGAFWTPGSHYAIEAGKAVTNGWIPPHAHNGFIDIALDVGLIGLGIFLVIFITSFLRALKLAYASRDRENLWYLAFLSFLAMNNMTESCLLRLDNLYWVLFIATTLTLSSAKQHNKFKQFSITYS